MLIERVIALSVLWPHLSSRDDYHNDKLFSVMQQYQQLFSELMERSMRSDDSCQRMQELLSDRDGVQVRDLSRTHG